MVRSWLNSFEAITKVENNEIQRDQEAFREMEHLNPSKSGNILVPWYGQDRVMLQNLQDKKKKSNKGMSIYIQK